MHRKQSQMWSYKERALLVTRELVMHGQQVSSPMTQHLVSNWRECGLACKEVMIGWWRKGRARACSNKYGFLIGRRRWSLVVGDNISDSMCGTWALTSFSSHDTWVLQKSLICIPNQFFIYFIHPRTSEQERESLGHFRHSSNSMFSMIFNGSTNPFDGFSYLVL